MPFRQKLRSAFLRFPCGHGGSQFTSRREDLELIPPARVRPPQAEPSGVESAPPPPAIPRIRRTPGVHKDTLNFLGARSRYSRRATDGEDCRAGRSIVDDRNSGGGDDEEDEVSGRATGETKRMFAIGPDDDPPSSLREPGHYDNIGNPILDPDLSQHSQLGDSYRLPSFENSTSDYSGHSITHSIGVIPQIPSCLEHTSTEHPHSTNTPTETAPQGTVRTPAVSIVDNVNDINLSERPADQSSAASGGGTVVYHENLVVGPVGHPGMIDDRKWFNQGQGREREREPMLCQKMERDYDKEDGHQHKHEGLCADYIAQDITSRQNQNIPMTTTVETRLLEPIVHTRIRPREREEVTNVITRETHTTHIHPTIQPVINPIYLPQKYYLEREPGSGRLVEITPEQAVRSGWDEIWHGSWTVGHDRDMGCGGDVDETRSVKRDKDEMQGGNRVSVY